VRVRYQHHLPLTGIEPLIHYFETEIWEADRVPCEILVFIGRINIEPYHIIGEVVEVEAEVHVAHLVS
jgi:hypothetical protein